VNRQFTAPGPDRLWVADITYIPTWSGFLWLAVVLDVWSRRVVGWSMANHLKTGLVLAALDMGIAQRRPEAVIRHSDLIDRCAALYRRAKRSLEPRLVRVIKSEGRRTT
jgi:putative transposase